MSGTVPIEINLRKVPRQRRAVATVAVILEAAARILEESGLEGLTTNAVAARAGVSIGSLYQYFSGRAAILTALIREKRKRLLDLFHTACVEAESMPLERAVEHIVRCGMAALLLRPRLNRVLGHAEGFLPLNTETVAMHRQIIDGVAAILAAHGLANTELLAGDVVALLSGMADRALEFDDGNLGTLADRAVRAALGYLACDCAAYGISTVTGRRPA